MRSPIDILIDSTVRCLTCGASYGACDCAAAQRRAAIDAEYKRLMALPDDELIAECKKVGVMVDNK